MAKKGYNVFISWSGERSLHVATALRDWIPKVVQAAKPWMSDADIAKGARSLHEVSRALEGSEVGIICLTPENLQEPWILFEAGALSKAIGERTRLCTYLIGGLRFQDVRPPLGMFQGTKADKEDTRKLIQTINAAISQEPLAPPTLDDIFDAIWPKLDNALQRLPPAPTEVESKRDTQEIVAEILEITRADSNRRRQVDWLDEYIPVFKDFFPLLRQIVQAAKASGITGAQSGSETPGEVGTGQTKEG